MIAFPHPDKIDAAERWLQTTFDHPPFSILKQVEKSCLDRVWLLEISGDGGVSLLLKVVIPTAFPKQMIDVYWLHGTNKTYAHCFPDGKLCLVEHPPNFINLERDMNSIFNRAARLIDSAQSGVNDCDFYTEPLPYWSSFIKSKASKSRVIQRATVFNAVPVATHACVSFYGYRSYDEVWFLAAKKLDAKSLASRSSKGVDLLSYSVGVRIPIERAWHPNEFPCTWKHVYHLLMASGRYDEVLSLLEAERKHDPWLATIIIYFDAPGVSYGFILPSEKDNGRTRNNRFVKRPLKHTKIAEFFLLALKSPMWHCDTYHLDTESLFSRLALNDLAPRQSANVLLAGCGSLGSMIAEELVLAGVKRLTLVDHDCLNAGNLCRHVLGMKDLGRFKALALKEHLNERMPLLEVEHFVGTVESYLHTYNKDASDFDLILGMTGESGPLWVLDSWRNAQSHRAPPMLVGWAESYGLASHAVLLMNGKTMHDIETPNERAHNIVEWSEGVPNHLFREPGCSSTFQPMGRSKLLYAAAINVELALEVIDGNIGNGTAYSFLEPENSALSKNAKSKSPELHDSVSAFNSAVVVRDV